MADTIVDDAPQATLPDPLEPLPERPVMGAAPASPPPGVGGQPPKGPNKRRALALSFAVLGALVVVGAVAFYLFLWRYEPSAHKHIPQNANIAGRVELLDVAIYKPVRTHLWPLLVEPSNGRKGKSHDESIRDETGLDLATDVREVVIASTDATSWVILLGGKIPRGRFVKGLAKVAEKEGWSGFKMQGELLTGPGGIAVGQADDGTIALGTDASIVTAALPVTEEGKLKLPEGAPITFAMTKRAWQGVASLAELVRAEDLAQVERVTGRFVLGDNPKLTLALEPAPGASKDAVGQQLESALSALRLVMFLLPDVMGEKTAIGSAKVGVTAEKVIVSAPWPEEGLDKGCRRLASLIRAAEGL